MINRTLIAIGFTVISSACAGVGGAVQQGSDANAIHGASITPLLAAVASRNEARVSALLQAGAKPDDPDAARSPLVQAMTSFDPAKSRELFCNKAIVKALLEHGADPNRSDPMIGSSLPLEVAFGIGDWECATIIKNAGGKIGSPEVGYHVLAAAVQAAARTGDFAGIDLAVRWGIDPNTHPSTGGTVLHEAVWVNSAAVAQALLARGVNPCTLNGILQTPLDMARNLHRSAELIALLTSVTHCAKDARG